MTKAEDGPASALSEKAPTRPHRSGRTFLVGAISGIITSSILQPLDVIRTHLQAPGSAPAGTTASVSAVVGRILQREGVRGLWRGTGPTCVRIGLGAGLYFTLLDQVISAMHSLQPPAADVMGGKDKKAPQLSAPMTMAAGAVTRSIAAAALCPITVVKTRMEYVGAEGPMYKGTLQAMAAIARAEGVRGLFSGMGPTLLRDAPYSGLYLLLYARLRTALQETVLPEGTPRGYSNLLAGALAGAASTLVTHPPDVVRTRMQLAGGRQQGMRATVLAIVQTQGMAGFFRGVGPRVAKRALQQALTWTIFEELASVVIGRSIWGSGSSSGRQ